MEDNKYSFNTLVKENGVKYDSRWKPLTITYIEDYFKNGMLKNMSTNLRKNIAYNYQYLEYLSYQLQELELNAAIKNSIYKNYVIISSSIIEAIFFWLIKSNGLNAKKNLELIFSTKSNQTKHDSDSIIVETNVYRKILPVDVEMSYDSMIKKIESKHLLNISHNAYPYIKGFRQLRNRIHLQVSDTRGSTDWWAFSIYDYHLIKYILSIILLDENIRGTSKDTYILYFLKLTEGEMEELRKHLKRN